MHARPRPSADELSTPTGRSAPSQVRIATDRGDIVVKLFPDDAPMHAAAFLKLVKSGFYDGLTFHRVEPGFVVQGGDPDGNGTGRPGYRLHAEFNARPHQRGTLAMARSSNPDSAGSQFYICLADARFLDNQYTVFGGMTERLRRPRRHPARRQDAQATVERQSRGHRRHGRPHGSLRWKRRSR